MRTNLEKYLTKFYSSRWSKYFPDVNYNDFICFWLGDEDLVNSWELGLKSKLRVRVVSKEVCCLDEGVSSVMKYSESEQKTILLPKTHHIDFSGGGKGYWENKPRHPNK